jgi:hypothetical protein
MVYSSNALLNRRRKQRKGRLFWRATPISTFSGRISGILRAVGELSGTPYPVEKEEQASFVESGKR